MKKYSIIYADPPWAYRTYSKKGQGRSAESHYPTMCIEDIKALPVGELAAKDCALFLWITFPCLCEALEVLTSWGFSYKTVAFVWVKQNRRNDDLFTGMGYWTRANAEICILATKGHPKRVDAGVRQVILSHIEEHSKKPDEARERIVRLMGDLPRVELFARLKSIPKSRMKRGSALFGSWETFPAWSFLPVSLPKAGTFGATRSNARLIFLWRKHHAAAKTHLSS